MRPSDLIANAGLIFRLPYILTVYKLVAPRLTRSPSTPVSSFAFSSSTQVHLLPVFWIDTVTDQIFSQTPAVNMAYNNSPIAKPARAAVAQQPGAAIQMGTQSTF